MSLSLRSKLQLTAGVVQALVLAVSLGAAYRIFSRTLMEELQREAVLTRQVLVPAVLPPLVERSFADLQEVLHEVSRDTASSLLYIQVIDSAGRVVAQSGVAPDDLPAAPGSLAGLSRLGAMRYEAPISGIAAGGPAYGALRFGLSLQAHDQGLAKLSRTLLLIGGIGLTLGLLLQGLIARALTRRLQQLVQGVQALQAQRQNVTLPDTGDDEIGELGRAFNAMARTLVQQLDELRASEQRHRSLTESLNDGVLLFDEQRRVRSSNSAAQRILGLSAAQLGGDEAPPAQWQIFDAQGRPLAPEERPSALALRTGQPVRQTLITVQRPDGSRVWIQTNAEPMFRTGETRPYAVASSFSDVSVRVEAERHLRHSNEILDERVRERTSALEAARAQAEAANQAKSGFLSRMSHELRTPLNAILGFAQVLQHRATPRAPGEREMLGHVEQAGWHLLALINDVLDLSRIETGTLAVSSEPVALAPLCEESLRMTETLAREQAITLHFLPVPGAALTALADKTRLRQVLVNLLSNAVKYNRVGGEVWLTLADAEGFATLTVRDTGHGMSPAQLERLFEPFNRLGAEAGPVQGTGIGLVITKHLVELMGGTLEVRSVQDHGTEFIVRLQRGTHGSAAAPRAAAAEAMPLARPVKLLYVEDNEANVALMREVVRLRPGLTLRVAVEPWDGLAQARLWQPDLIALDIALPHMDGFELLARLRSEAGSKRVPVIAVTANALPSDRQRALAAGFDAYCTKPLRIADFMQQLDRLLPPETPDA